MAFELFTLRILFCAYFAHQDLWNNFEKLFVEEKVEFEPENSNFSRWQAAPNTGLYIFLVPARFLIIIYIWVILNLSDLADSLSL